MLLNKGLTYALLAAITLTPWNATAVNNYSVQNFTVNNLFHKPKLRALTGLAENLLAKSLVEVTQGNTQQALNTLDELIQKK